MILFRSLLLLLIALAAAPPSVAAAEPQRALFTFTGLADGKFWDVTWAISETKLKATSEWNPEKEPPLSITQAIEAARKHLQRLGRPHTLPVRSIALQLPIAPKPTEKFYFYLVSFHDGDYYGITEDMDIVVLLDGSIVLPVRSIK